MKLILKLMCLKTVSQEHFFRGYFTAMHGLLANVAGKDEKYGKFTFGNIHPIINQKIEAGKEYSIIVSSSEPSIIERLFFFFSEGKVLNIGELQFRVVNVAILSQTLRNNSVIESVSPVNITVHENGRVRFLKFGDKDYLKYLEKSLLSKYEFLTGETVGFGLFENVKLSVHEKHPFASFQINFFNKQKNDNFKVCGSKLVLGFNGISDAQLKIFQKLFDAGFGERTTFGAGFMIERYKKK